MKKKIGIALSLMMSLSIVNTDLNIVNAENDNQEITEYSNSVIDSGKCGDNATWQLTNDGTLTISGSGAMYDVFPTSKPGYILEKPWEKYCSDVKKVVVQNGITHIGDFNFNGFENATSLSIANSVKTIGSISFAGWSKLTSVSIPDSVESIGGQSFSNCEKLTDIKLSNNLKVIEGDLFYGCSSLETITLPKSVTTLSWQCFAECDNLKKITLPESITDLGEYTFYDCDNLKEVNIPSKVTTIKDGVFSLCPKLKNIVIPRTITSIEDTDLFDKTITLKVYDNSYGLLYAKENGYSYELIKEAIQPTSIKLNTTSKTIQKGKTYTLVPTISPTNVTNKTVTYTSSNSKVATVTTNGTIKAINGGTAAITAKTSNGKKASCKVTVPYTVKYNLNGGTNNKSNPTSYYGKKITLKNPTRKGYVFAGWYSDSKYKTKVTSFSSGNKNLYAKWNKVTVGKNNIRLSKVGSNKIKISYNAVSGVKGYQIQYSSNASFTSSKTQKTNALSYTTSSLTKGKTYYARVRGYKMDSVGSMVYGKWSNIKSLYIAKPVVQPKPSTSVSSMVYISKTGSKYHSNLNCSNMKNPSHISINEAKRRGLGPCSKCYK